MDVAGPLYATGVGAAAFCKEAGDALATGETTRLEATDGEAATLGAMDADGTAAGDTGTGALVGLAAGALGEQPATRRIRVNAAAARGAPGSPLNARARAEHRAGKIEFIR